MSICNHGLAPEKCILCKKLLPPEPPQNHKMAAPQAIQPVAPNVPLDGHSHKPGEYCVGCAELMGTHKPVHIMNAPQITDPQAKNVLQLAQEYAQAQDDVSIIRANVEQLQDTLAESKIKLGEAEKNCATKKKVLNEAINPMMVLSAATGMTESEENEEPSYVNKYKK